MANMLQIKGLNQVLSRFKRLERKSKKEDNVDVAVGYTANYALIVHEIHATKSKYLENPFREMEKELTAIIKATRVATESLLKGLMIAGLRLQRESQKRVPVDTGNLKGSAFTRKV